MADQPQETADDATTSEDDALFPFNVIIAGRREYLQLVGDPDLLTGQEVLLIEREAGLRVRDWFDRIGDLSRWHGVDMLLVSFIGANHKQLDQYGTSELAWDEFARVCRPLSLRRGGEPAEPDPPPTTNRAQRRASAKA